MRNTFLIFTFLFIQCSLYSQNVNHKAWIEDIDFYQSQLEARHINLYHTISKKEFDNEVKLLKNKLSVLSDFQIRMELMRITRKIGNGESDGHTSVPLWGTKRHYFPIELFAFGQEYRLLSTIAKYENLLGLKLVKIDGEPINKITQKVETIAQFVENKHSLMQRSMSYLKTSEILHSFGLTKAIKKAEFLFEDDNGNVQKVNIDALTATEYNNSKLINYSLNNPGVKRPDDAFQENLWFKTLKDSETLFLKFRRFTSMNEMDKFGNNVVEYIDSNNIRNLIIDLRENYGGNFFVASKLAEYLVLAESLNWKTGVYVITDRYTYSAAMCAAVIFRQILNAKIVGEPTGGNPYGYQDLGQFNLPNSNLIVTYSKHLFRFQQDNTKGVQPDQLINPKWEYYKQRIDKPVDWILNDIKNNKFNK